MFKGDEEFVNNKSLASQILEMKEILINNTYQSVMVGELIRMRVIVPIDANPDWMAQRLSEEIIIKISEN